MNRVFLLIWLLVASSMLFFSCSKDKTTEPHNPTVPVLTTATVSAITQTTAQCGGTVTSDGGESITARGVCWSLNQSPGTTDSKTTDGTGTGSFVSSVNGLSANTPYYVRAYATNTAGTGYGSAVLFTTTAVPESTGTVVDIDGNSYPTVKIGAQWWMAENLKVTHYRNGEAIADVTDDSTWLWTFDGAFCSYNNDIANVAVYGRLYNWLAVNDSSLLAPAGWHVPSDTEWQALVDYLGGDTVAGGKMKEVGAAHWHGLNYGATNESGFTGRPGGYRFSLAEYVHLGDFGYFWSSTGDGGSQALIRYLFYNDLEAHRSEVYMRLGLSVRCVID